MEEFKAGGKTFRAWSQMRCEHGGAAPVKHEPHTWNSSVVSYGPYFCPGHQTEEQEKYIIESERAMTARRKIRDVTGREGLMSFSKIINCVGDKDPHYRVVMTVEEYERLAEFIHNAPPKKDTFGLVYSKRFAKVRA